MPLHAIPRPEDGKFADTQLRQFSDTPKDSLRFRLPGRTIPAGADRIVSRRSDSTNTRNSYGVPGVSRSEILRNFALTHVSSKDLRISQTPLHVPIHPQRATITHQRRFELPTRLVGVVVCGAVARVIKTCRSPLGLRGHFVDTHVFPETPQTPIALLESMGTLGDSRSPGDFAGGISQTPMVSRRTMKIPMVFMGQIYRHPLMDATSRNPPGPKTEDLQTPS